MAGQYDFDELFREYQDRIYSMLYYMTGSSEDARELCQETFLKVWRALPKFRGEAQLYTWIYKIALNTGRRHLKKKGRMKTVSLEVLTEEGFDIPEAPEQSKERMRLRVQNGLAELAPDQKEVLLLYYYEERTYEEIARLVGIPIGTVKSRLNRAKRALRERVKPVEEENVGEF